eukprot:SAG31_NODE_10860_length_1089_cov_1.649495_1_plen_129_part_10
MLKHSCTAELLCDFHLLLQTANLFGRVAIVTGCRVKIGYRCTVKLLRCGAAVIGTTRFPVDAATRFAAEPDFHIWGKRLQVYGLDFRDLPNLERFCEHVQARYQRLDIIINNACFNIRPTPEIYTHLMA